ncbi:transmembrane protein 212 isoform X1 [Ahaetulla prasina]|uniref:transmembrane protein 212 isoform X1 n=1 Tax=Ahaetulla prasina TaxID=499056 RepID=UPI0026476F1E|nr:transmembrane protein 212 isoform X1 [Ahaetulla prasina]
MNTRKLFLVTGKMLISSGILSLILGTIAFFPVFSYKPGFVGWSVRIASPIWSGSLAVIAGVLITLAEKQRTSRYLWEAAFALGIFNVISSPVQGTIAMASLLLGPYCYYSFAGVSGTNYLSYAISSVFPYGKFASSCKDPLHYEWYHLVLQMLDFISGLVILSASLTTVVKLTARLFQLGHLNVTSLKLPMKLPLIEPTLLSFHVQV